MKEEMFQSYPDIVDIKQLCKMLGGIGAKSAYHLLHDGSICYFNAY